MYKQRAVYPSCMEATSPYAENGVFLHLILVLHLIVPYQQIVTFFGIDYGLNY